MSIRLYRRFISKHRTASTLRHLATNFGATSGLAKLIPGRAPGLSFSVPIVCLVLWLGLSTAAHAQDSPRELRRIASTKLAQGAFLDAIPDLEQLIMYLGKSKKLTIIASLEMIYYNLGICHFFVGQFDQAEKAFNIYFKKYPRGSKRSLAFVYMGDALRLRGSFKKAVGIYNSALAKYMYSNDMKADIYSAIARCYLAQGDWGSAAKPLKKVYRIAPDSMRRNWAATLLTTAYFKGLEIDNIYPLVPYLLRRNSFASRSIAFNMAALEAGDALFADESYRDALWVFRMVYPHDTILTRSEQYLEYLEKQAERTKQHAGSDPRQLMRIQESIGELEAEIKALGETEDYDIELHYRIALGYMEMFRYWEAREMFLYLHDISKEKAEEALFLAFQCSCRLLPWDRAFELGEQYMEKYPSGEFFDLLTLAMGQLYARQQSWAEVIRHFTRTLEMSPNHESAAECMFLIGYASFMEEKFKDAVRILREMNEKYPGNDLVEESAYWIAMALLFDGNYKESLAGFDKVCDEFPSGGYAEDSRFRGAVCCYGMSLFEESDRRLKEFMASYSKSKLISEAIMMRGDIAGALGRLKNATKFYQRAMTYDILNIEYYNHCAFQCGKIMVEDERYEELRAHFQRYVKTNREGSNIPQAVYWVGVSLWNTGEQEGAMRYYRQAVQEYGGDPKQVGIDMILDEWVSRTKRSSAEEARLAWQELQEAQQEAVRKSDVTMALRLKRVLLFHPKIDDEWKKEIVAALLQEDHVEFASPAVLQTMLDFATERGDNKFATKVAKHIIKVFTETDYALDARMTLAKNAMATARGKSNPREARKYYARAVRHLEVIREVFATSGDAGQALMLLGNLYREQENYKEADERYKALLGVKGWRSFWPEALYWRGECAFLKRNYVVASAYYERIYLMYSHHGAWAAKAYLRRAECLRRSHQNKKSIEVLREMLGNGDLADFEETKSARQLLAKLERSL